MNIKTFNLNTFILQSNNNHYKEKEYKNLTIKNKIGEGAYGLVFLIDNDHVIKIFKNSTYKNTILSESNYLLPIENENRELIFFYKYIDKKIENNFIINLYAIGVIRDVIMDNSIKLDINSYFIILPLCIPFYEVFNLWNVPLINEKNGINFTLNVMKRLVDISIFLEKKLNVINLDFKLNNFLFSNKSNDLNNLIMIDFSIIKKYSKKEYESNNLYYIWPESKLIKIENIPSYSISVNALELLFGNKEIISLPNNDKINNFLKVIEKKNKKLHKILYYGLVLKINTDIFLKLFR
jgi:serine/threonine protein kinase